MKKPSTENSEELKQIIKSNLIKTFQIELIRCEMREFIESSNENFDKNKIMTYINDPDIGLNDVLNNVIKFDKLDILKYLNNTYPEEFSSEKASDMLSTAAEESAINIAKWLVEEKEADIEVHDFDICGTAVLSNTPLGLAAKNGNNEMVEYLLSQGAKPDGIPGYTRFTPLYNTIESNNSTTAELLLSNGANPNKATLNGLTPLHHCARYNKFEIAKLLLVYGANNEKVVTSPKELKGSSTYEGKIPLELAIEKVSDVTLVGEHCD